MIKYIDCETLKEIDNSFELLKDIPNINLTNEQVGTSEEIKND